MMDFWTLIVLFPGFLGGICFLNRAFWYLNTYHPGQTHTHTHKQTHIYIYIYIMMDFWTLFIHFPGFLGGLCFLNRPLWYLNTHHPGQQQRLWWIFEHSSSAFLGFWGASVFWTGPSDIWTLITQGSSSSIPPSFLAPPAALDSSDTSFGTRAQTTQTYCFLNDPLYQPTFTRCHRAGS